MYQSRGFYITTPENRVLVSVVGVLVLVVGYYLDWPGSRQKDMPPVGFVVCLPRGSQPDLSFRIRELNRKYGPLASLKIGSSNVIIIGGDGKLVRELLDKRGSIYSNRPAEPTLQIAGGGDHLLFQQDTEKWRAARKQIVRHYPRASDPEQVRLQEAESVQLLYDFLHDPERHIKHSMRYTTSIIACLNYGVRCATYDDPVIHGIESIMTRISRPLVEHFPFLWILPDFMTGNWKAKALHLKQLMLKIYGGLAEIGSERGKSGLNTDNFAYKLRLDENVTNLTRNHQAQICGIALEGVAGVISTAILALLEDTTSQDRARQEIDGIYDEYTLPRWADEERMPFVRAIVRETLRWRPPLPSCVSHRLEQDDTYAGYFLPKDSTGRRSCPGVQLAEQGIFIAICRLLWAFEFSVPLGTTVNTDQSAFHGSIRRPKQYPVVITPRSERRVETIEREMLSAKESVFSLYGSYK
ncbi:unnamed protein product [Rhizoctonia solani]|uniref:Cytochrome P450 n=1 Tax=Rhizoctonia solani TaxID=456999 RepID=A0A8H3BYD9_9AGAM|nr:unnamed protein product [Rhizoctonia solani]